jgi:WD40 repeat protein
MALRSPFKGLAPFDDSPLDALLFFGREREIEIIVANLIAKRLTVLYGPSGVGKTSLLRAGVAQRLHAEPDALVVLVSSWAGDPVTEILDATEEAALRAVGSEIEPARRIGSLADVLGRWARRLNSSVYVVLDQFEEYLLYHEGESGPGTLIEELPEGLRRRDLRVNFLLGIREDALAELDPLKGRVPNLLANTLRLERLDRRAAEAAIVGPIREYNRFQPGEPAVEIEPELVDTVLHEVAAGRVDLGPSGRGGLEAEPDEGRIEAPYLQLVLERLWDVDLGRGNRRLCLETLRELGGSARIVRDHLELAMSELSDEEKNAAAAMYNHLVTPSGTKIAHRVGDLAGYADVDEADAARVLSRLVEQRIVRAGEDGAAGPRYEIFHDVLADAVLAWRERHEADRRLESERAFATRRHRRTLAVAVGAVVMVAILSALSVYALTQRSNARSEARHARARELAALAISNLANDPVKSLRLALRANAIEASAANEDVLRTSLKNLRELAVLPGGGRDSPVAGAEFSRDGRFVVTAGGAGEARLFRTDTGRRVRSFRHGAPLVAAVLNPDASRLVTAGSDGVAAIWDVRTAARLRSLQHDGLTSATLSPNGRLFATTSSDGSVRIWELSTGRLVHAWALGRPVKSASFSGDGRFLATMVDPIARDRSIRIFDVRSGRLVRRLVQKEPATTMRFAPHRYRLVTGSATGVLRVWDTQSGDLLHHRPAHNQHILYAEFSAAGDEIVSASTDQTGAVWTADLRDRITNLSVHRGYVLRAHFSPDGKTVVTASADHSATVFDTESGTVLISLVGHEEPVTDAVFSPDGTKIASVSSDGTARLWDALPLPRLTLLGRHRGEISSLAISPDSRLVASAGKDGEVRVWNLGGGLVRRLRTGGAVVRAAFSRDGSLLVAASADGKAHVWRTADWTPVVTLPNQRALVTADISPDARFVATADAAGAVRLWEISTGRPRWTRVWERASTAVAFSPDGHLLLTAGADKIARLLRVDDGALVHPLARHRRRLLTASFSPDGRRLVTASLDGTAIVWNTATGAPVHVLRGHTGRRITSVSFSPDGRLVATTSSEHNTRVWNAESGRRPRWVFTQAATVNGAAFSADGRWLVTAGPTARVWQLSNGQTLVLLERTKLLTAVAFAPQGWRFVTGAIDGSVRTFECVLCQRTARLVAIAQRRLARLGR